MCKYCKYRDVTEDDTGYEKSNEVQMIGRVKEGHLAYDLMLNRYHADDYRDSDDACHNIELIMELNVVDPNGVYRSLGTISEKHIKIKYCPFCGEKL